MSKEYYSWTNFEIIHPDDPLNPRRITKIGPGEKVDADSLGVSDDEFQSLIDNGAVRAYEHPDMGNFTGSPVELAKAKAFAAMEGGYFDTQYGTIEVEAPEVDPETGKTMEAGANKMVIGGREV